MNKTNYRDRYKRIIVNADESDIDKTDFLLVEDVAFFIDEIEGRVNEIISKLDCIKGLTEIDEIKEQLSSLSKDLY